MKEELNTGKQIMEVMREIEIANSEEIRQQELEVLCKLLKKVEHLEHLKEIGWDIEERIIKLKYEDHTVVIKAENNTSIEMLEKLISRVHCDQQRKAIEKAEKFEKIEGLGGYKEVVDYPRYQYKQIATSLYSIMDMKTRERTYVEGRSEREAAKNAYEYWRRIYG